jgi:hypothetical protein
VEALAVTDPDRAECIASSITGKDRKAEALTGVAKALAVTDPVGIGFLEGGGF